MDLEKKRLRKLQQIGLDRPLLAGSLNRVERKDASKRTAVYHLLTLKEGGKTRSVYVPKDLVKEVRSWIRNHRRLKQAMSEISTMSIGIIQGHVARKRTRGPDGGAKSPGKQSNP
ncbi:MAG: DUF6788 family protein [Candidatus Hydrogenedentales bacterium]|jgi:hypothetical protein